MVPLDVAEHLHGFTNVIEQYNYSDQKVPRPTGRKDGVKLFVLRIPLNQTLVLTLN